jgi:hypothetical protein
MAMDTSSHKDCKEKAPNPTPNERLEKRRMACRIAAAVEKPEVAP